MKEIYSTIKFHETAGFYEPAFFRMFINTKKPINPTTLNFIELGTFVHEYTHFLQDFSTIYGLLNIFSMIDKFRDYSHMVVNSSSIDLPLRHKDEIFKLNDKLKSSAFGTSSKLIFDEVIDLDLFKPSKIHFEKETLDKHPDLKNYSVLRAKATLEKGGEQEIEIGSLAVIESMAACAERLMGFNTDDAPNYPYNVVPFMAKKLCPAIADKDDVLFALCDCVLQVSSTPGMFLYNMMSDIQSGKLDTPKTGLEVYNNLSNFYKEWHNPHDDSWVNTAKVSLLELVGGPLGEQYQAWVNKLFDYTIDKRRNDPAFLLKMCLEGNFYQPIIETIGTPLLFNQNQDYTKVPQHYDKKYPVNYDVELFMTWKYVMNVLMGGKRNCPLLWWCAKSGIPVIDRNCIENPPLHSRTDLYKEFCPVGVYWKHKAFGDYSFAPYEQKLIKIK